MRVGIELIFGAESGSTIAECGEVAAKVEDLGFSSLWAPEHVVLFGTYAPNYPYSPDGTPPVGTHGMVDPLWALAAASVGTKRIRLGTGVLILPQRNPLILAKEVVALDQLSGGRLELGVGVGWSPEEFAALGVPFEHRGRRADEYIEAMSVLWQENPSSYEGEFVSFQDAIALPKPVQSPRPPILVGGQTRAALRRAARLGDGWISWMMPTDEIQAAHELADSECSAIGRDPHTLRRLHVTPYADSASFSRYLDIAEQVGAEEVVAVPWVTDQPLNNVLEEMAELVAAR